MTAQMLVRLDVQQKKALSSLSHSEGRNASDVVRELIEHYINEHDMAACLDGLWNRIGKRMRQAGKSEKDIDGHIKAWRSSKE